MEQRLRLGVALNITAEAERNDASVFREHLRFGDAVEELGFDSLFVLEHHFSGYVLSPAPFELLAYYAARTQRVVLGTAVIVLPWHDPIRVAEQIAVLDIMSDGRCMFAFGRGRARSEYDGFRIAMSEAKGRFREGAEIVTRALRGDNVEYRGQYYQIPALSIRPAPHSHPEARFYGSATSAESVGTIAELGFGLMLATHKSWQELSDSVTTFRAAAACNGNSLSAPVILASVSVAERQADAVQRAREYMLRDTLLADAHYGVSSDSLVGVPGYESYAQPATEFGEPLRLAAQDKATADYMNWQIVGTPHECSRQLSELQRVTGCDHVILEFGYGGMPISDATSNMRLFAAEVVPLCGTLIRE